MVIFVSRFKGGKVETVNESSNSVDLFTDRMKKGKRRMQGVEKGTDIQDTHPFPRR